MNWIKAALLGLTVCGWAQETEKKDYGRLYGGFESNAAYYLDDSKLGDFAYEDRFRSNNYLMLNYNYKSFTAGLQLEGYEKDALLNYNPKYKGTELATYYATYKGKHIEATAGYFFEQFGSGLILRTWEDRQLGINNALRGGRLVLKPTENLTFTALYGQQRTGFDVSEGKILGFNSEIGLGELLGWESVELSTGLSYVGRYEKFETTEPLNFDELTNAYSARLNLSVGSFYVTSEFNYKDFDGVLLNQTVTNNFVKPGSAFLLNFGYTQKNLGVDVSLRRLENFTLLSERIPESLSLDNTSLNYNDKILNYTPALTKQHHSLLANIYVYQSQRVGFDGLDIMKAGETGGQADIYYTFKKGTALGGKHGTKIAVNGSMWYNLPGTYSYSPANYTTELTGRGRKYFSDYNIEFKKKFSEKLHSGFAYINQYYNKRWLEGGTSYDPVKTHIVSAESTYSFNDKQSIRIEGEHLWTQQDKKNWAGGTVEYTLNKHLSFYVWDIYNYGNDDSSKQTHYYNVGGAYRKGSTRLALNYGRQRGGLVCVGGVCRFVPESTGLTLSLNTSF